MSDWWSVPVPTAKRIEERLTAAMESLPPEQWETQSVIAEARALICGEVPQEHWKRFCAEHYPGVENLASMRPAAAKPPTGYGWRCTECGIIYPDEMDPSEGEDCSCGAAWDGCVERITFDARPAAAEGVENEDSGMWLLQDLRSIVGNSMLWWNKDGKGYGCDVRGAHRFTREEALYHVQAYDRLRAYPADYIVGLTKHHIDFQYVDRDRALTPDDGEGQADG